MAGWPARVHQRRSTVSVILILPSQAKIAGQDINHGIAISTGLTGILDFDADFE